MLIFLTFSCIQKPKGSLKEESRHNTTINAMSFNIRYNNPADDNQNWHHSAKNGQSEPLKTEIFELLKKSFQPKL